MYFLHQCYKNNGKIRRYASPNLPCFNHLNCLAKAIEYIFNYGKYLTVIEYRWAVLQHLCDNEIYAIGYVSINGIFDKIESLAFSFKELNEKVFTIQFFEIDRVNGKIFELAERRRGAEVGAENGLKTLIRAITFLSRPLGAHYEKVRYKQAVILKNDIPLYIVNENGIFDTENKELLNFWQFNVSIDYGFRILSDNNF